MNEKQQEQRKWTVQELLQQLERCASDNFCAMKCEAEPCVLERTEFLHGIAARLEMQRAENAALRQANEGHRFMLAKMQEELQKQNERYTNMRRRTLEEIQKLLEESGEKGGNDDGVHQ